MNIVGIDACKYGWCVIGLIGNNMFWGCFKSIEKLIQKYPQLNRILIDIPIGLSSEKFMRTVDAEARKFLTLRKSSIFSPPCREALFAVNYKNALIINKKIEGKGISVQAYNIGEKIKEIDQWIDKNSSNVDVFEAHPELCFKTLNADQDIRFSKHIKEGIEERKQIVFGYDTNFEDIFENIMENYKRAEVKPDDILDAMALFLVNRNSKTLKIISDENALDASGKNVGIVYG